MAVWFRQGRRRFWHERGWSDGQFSGTVKLDSGWTYGDDFTVSGPGSIVPGRVCA